jgi:DNA-binding response OmpR family regulator
MEKEHFDVVVLDIMMPRMDGYDVVHAMKTNGMRDRTRVLFLTAKASEGDWARGYRSGADDYLTKPFDGDELIAKIDMLVSSSKEKLAQHRQEELDRAQLLSRLESLFDTAPHRPPS